MTLRARRQEAGKNFKRYLVSLQGILKQSGCFEGAQLERIYWYSADSFQLYACPHDFKTFNNLVTMVVVFENLQTLRMCSNHPRSAIWGFQQKTCIHKLL